MVIHAVSKKNEFYDVCKYLTHIMAKAFLIAVFILMILLFFFFSFYFGDLFLNVKSGNYKNPLFGAYVIVSQSMVPTIKVNDAIVVKRVDNEELNIGDIITFAANDTSLGDISITHRIVSKQVTDSGDVVYRTKGDNNTSEDSGIVDVSDIYGKVILKIPKIGYVQQMLSSPAGFLIAILIPLGLVIISDIYKMYKALKLKKEEIEII